MARRKSGFRALLAFAWLMLGFLALPMLIAFPVSLTPERYLILPSDELSLRHYVNLFTNPDWLSSIWQSLVVATASAALALVLGSLCAIGLWRLASNLSETIRGFLLLPLVMPPIISALAFYRIFIDFDKFVGAGLIDSYAGLIIAHTILGAPYALITVSVSLAGLDPNLERASRSLGGSIRQTLWWVILPNIKPGLITGGVLAFITSWDEIVVALFISRFDIFTLPRRMWDGVTQHTDPTVAAAASMLILLTVTAITLARLTAWRKERNAPDAAA